MAEKIGKTSARIILDARFFANRASKGAKYAIIQSGQPLRFSSRVPDFSFFEQAKALIPINYLPPPLRSGANNHSYQNVGWAEPIQPKRKNDKAEILASQIDELLEAIRHLGYKDKIDLSEYQSVFDNLKTRAASGRLDHSDIYRLFDRFSINREIRCEMIKAAIAGNNRIFNDEILAKYAEDLNERDCYSASALLSAIAETYPEFIGPQTFEKLAEATEESSEQMKSGNPEPGTGGEFIFQQLLKVPKLYAGLIAKVGFNYKVLRWLLYEEHETIMEDYDRTLEDYREREAMTVQLKEEAAATGETVAALMRRSETGITPVNSGDLAVDKFIEQGRQRPFDAFDRITFELLLKTRPEDKTEYFSAELYREITRLLSTDQREGALKFLEAVTVIDLNEILRHAEAFGEEIGTVLGMPDKKAIEYGIINRNMKKYHLANLFTAWAIGDRVLTPLQLQEIKGLEELLAKEMPFLTYYVVKTVLDETNGWSINDIHRLWKSELFKHSQNAYTENIAWILALAGENKDKMLLLMEKPGKLKQWWGSNLTVKRFRDVLINLDQIFSLPLKQIELRLDKINEFFFALEDETFARLLCHQGQADFEADLAAALTNGQYELVGISYGLRDRIKRFATIDGVEVAAMLPKTAETDEEKEDRESKIIPQSMAVISFLTGVSLFSPNQSKVRAAWKKRRKLHPDFNPSDAEKDPAAEQKFKIISEAYNIYLAVLKEIETGAALQDPEVRLLP